MKISIVYKHAVILCLITVQIFLIASSCWQEPTYSMIPQIKFKGFDRYTLRPGSGVGQSKRDSLVITLEFLDGNGDLGNTLPLNSDEENRYKQSGGWGNYKIRTFRLENSQYKEQFFNNNKLLIFPLLTKEGKVGPIKGDLKFKQLFPYGTRFNMYPTKFTIQIRDRLLNSSNEIETDTIHLPYSY